MKSLAFFALNSYGGFIITFNSQGLIYLTLSALLLTASGAPAPIFLPDPLTAVAFSAAGGLALTAASGAVLTIPTNAILLGKALVLKGALLGALAAQEEKRRR